MHLRRCQNVRQTPTAEWTATPTVLLVCKYSLSLSGCLVTPCLQVVCLLLTCCFTSTEAKMLIRNGGRRGGGDETLKSRQRNTARKRPERPWTAARTTEVLRRCPLAIAQRLVHCAVAVSTAVLGQSQGQCPLHCC